MTVKLLTERHLEFLSIKGAAQAHLILHLSKCHIVGNHMPRLNYLLFNCIDFNNNGNYHFECFLFVSFFVVWLKLSVEVWCCNENHSKSV